MNIRKTNFKVYNTIKFLSTFQQSVSYLIEVRTFILISGPGRSLYYKKWQCIDLVPVEIFYVFFKYSLKEHCIRY